MHHHISWGWTNMLEYCVPQATTSTHYSGNCGIATRSVGATYRVWYILVGQLYEDNGLFFSVLLVKGRDNVWVMDCRVDKHSVNIHAVTNMVPY